MHLSITLAIGILACIGYGVHAFPSVDPTLEFHHSPEGDEVYGDHEDYEHEMEGPFEDNMHHFDEEDDSNDGFWQEPDEQLWEDDSASEDSWNDEADSSEGSHDLSYVDGTPYDPEEYTFVFDYDDPANEFWGDNFGDDLEFEFYLPVDDFQLEQADI